MDPEPKGFRSVVLILSVVVVLSGIVGYFVWWIAFARGGPVAVQGGPSDAWTVVLHPVDFLPDTPPEQRRRITAAIDRLLAVPDNTPVGDSVLALAAFGEAAIPRVLDALHALDAKDGFRSEATRRQALSLDRALRRIAKANAYADPGPPPIGPHAEPEGFRLDAQQWFRWWESMRSPEGAPMGR